MHAPAFCDAGLVKHGKANEHVIHAFSLRIPSRLSGDSLPTRKVVVPWGTSQAVDGPVTVDSSSAQAFSAFQRAQGWDRVCLDYEHNTLPGTPAFKESREPRDVAAFGVPELIPGEGIVLNGMEWTPDGVKKASNFCDISPALVFAPGTRIVIGLHSVALTRAGAIEGLSAFSVSLPDPQPIGDKTMERAVLIALLGLDSSATDAQIQEAAQKLGAVLKQLGNGDICAFSAQVQQLKTLLDQVKGIDLKTISTQVEAFSAIGKASKDGIEGLAVRLSKAEQMISAFSADALMSARQAIIDQAKRDGKVLPFSAEALKTVALETLREVAANTPATIPMDQRTVEKQQVEPFSAGSRGDAATASAVAAKFGRKPEDLAKAGV